MVIAKAHRRGRRPGIKCTGSRDAAHEWACSGLRDGEMVHALPSQWLQPHFMGRLRVARGPSSLGGERGAGSMAAARLSPGSIPECCEPVHSVNYTIIAAGASQFRAAFPEGERFKPVTGEFVPPSGRAAPNLRYAARRRVISGQQITQVVYFGPDVETTGGRFTTTSATNI